MKFIVLFIAIFLLSFCGVSKKEKQNQVYDDVLKNTYWHYSYTIGFGDLIGGETWSFQRNRIISFCEEKYIIFVKNTGNIFNKEKKETESGIYKISDNLVTLNSSDGKITTGTIVGNELIINDFRYKLLKASNNNEENNKK